MRKITKIQSIKNFVAKWNGDVSEKSKAVKFWSELLHDVLDVERPNELLEPEKPVKIKKITKYIDFYLPATNIIIEHKSSDVHLLSKHKQSDGVYLNAYEQAKRYDNELPRSEKAKYIVICNFKSFWIYDMDYPNSEPIVILLDELPKRWHQLKFLIETKAEVKAIKEKELSVKAAKIIGDIYNEFIAYYGNNLDSYILRQLNILCVRLVFCLYAEDAGLFGFDNKTAFHDYLKSFRLSQMPRELNELFKVLNTPYDLREYPDDEVNKFPYVNGGLFEETITIPPFTEKIKNLLLNEASLGFDWSNISPTIFGAMFESTLNPETRSKEGMHYTSIVNIHKVIDPLFLNDLTRDLDVIENIKNPNLKRIRIEEYTDKLSSLKFLDPACGSGNFLTETYISLRRLENRALRILYGTQKISDLGNPVKVSISQFYGIEINDFAVAVAKTALWIAESQMLDETAKIIQQDIDFLPLKSYNQILNQNALTCNWNDVISSSELNYIIGNPPFSGARKKSKKQLNELKLVFSANAKGIGELDYVLAWYAKAAKYIEKTNIKVAFVSTDSISQGEQVGYLWTNLWRINPQVHIDFAWRSFQWDSEAISKAHVHVVIIGFSCGQPQTPIIYEVGKQPLRVKNINPYLFDGKNIVVLSSTIPLWNVPEMKIGSKPIDNSNYVFSPAQKDEFIKYEPLSEPLFHEFIGAEEFLKCKKRYCLWLGNCSPAQLDRMPLVMKRIQAVREFRSKSSDSGTRKLADRPTHFQIENFPKCDYLLIPRVTSENREYIPFGFITAEIYNSDATLSIIKADLYLFGILSSSLHMVWIDTIGGKLEKRYRYSKEIIYNNFPWLKFSKTTKNKIIEKAQAILDVRNTYIAEGNTYAQLYNPNLMPDKLRAAHKELDKAVLKAYKLPHNADKWTILKALLSLYEKHMNNKEQ